MLFLITNKSILLVDLFIGVAIKQNQQEFKSKESQFCTIN